jgi:hypothetical protein
VAATEGAKIHHHFLVYRSKDSACTTLPLRSQPGSVMAGGQHLFLSFLSSVYNLIPASIPEEYDFGVSYG